MNAAEKSDYLALAAHQAVFSRGYVPSKEHCTGRLLFEYDQDDKPFLKYVAFSNRYKYTKAPRCEHYDRKRILVTILFNTLTIHTTSAILKPISMKTLTSWITLKGPCMAWGKALWLNVRRSQISLHKWHIVVSTLNYFNLNLNPKWHM